MNESDNKRLTLLMCIFLAITTIAIYWQVNNHEFVGFDDNEYVTENRHVQTGLTSGNVTWAFTTFHAGNWHPLTWISHMLDCQLFGLKPGFHHLMNLFFHLANTILLFLILQRMTKAPWQSAFVAVIFAIHPLHVESVAWVAERKEVLSAFFWMLTMGAYVFYVEKQELKRYFLSIFFFALGLMAKPMLVTLPFVLLLLDFWPLCRLQTEKLLISEDKQSEDLLEPRSKKKGRRKSATKTEHTNNTETQTRQHSSVAHIVLEKIPFFVLSLASSMITYTAQQKGGAVGSLKSFPLPTRIANALVSYCAYIWKTIWPENLAVLYPHPGMLPAWEIVGVVFLLGITTFLIIKARKGYPYLTTGWLWYLGTLVPVIGLVQVGVQGMADRYTYVPLIGIAIIVAWGAPELLKKWRYRRIAFAAMAAITLCIFSFVTWRQVQYWQDSVTLFTRTVTVTTDNPIMQNNLGNALEDQGRLDEAIAHYTEALRIDPGLADSYNNIGLALTKLGKSDEATTNFLKAIKISPNYAAAHYNLGTVLASQGKLDEAVYHFRESIRIKPDYAKAYNNLGNVLLIQKKIDEAIDCYRRALRMNPDYIMARENLKDALARRMRNR